MAPNVSGEVVEAVEQLCLSNLEAAAHKSLGVVETAIDSG